MTLETATYINGLNSSYPEGGADRSTADDHLRLIKATVKASFPNITGAMTASQAELNLNVGNTKTLTTFFTKMSTSVSSLNTSVAAISGRLLTIWVPAGAMLPDTSSGAALTNDSTTANAVMLRSLAFDGATAEYAHFNIRMPKSWNEGGLQFQMLWTTTASSATGVVVWSVATRARSLGDALDATFTATVMVTSTTSVVQYLVQSGTSSVMTLDTPAENDLVFFKVGRLPANAGDTMAADAKLLGVVITYNVSGLTDA